MGQIGRIGRIVWMGGASSILDWYEPERRIGAIFGWAGEEYGRSDDGKTKFGVLKVNEKRVRIV